MTSGRHLSELPKLTPQYLSKMLTEEVLRRAARPVAVSFEYDVPYLCGYSKNSRSVYCDRTLAKYQRRGQGIWLRIDGEWINVLPYLMRHERIEKALIDLKGLRYQEAHKLATHEEHKMVTADGISWPSYVAALRPLIRRADDEKITRAPRDLDLTPYEDEGERKKMELLVKKAA